MTFYHWLGISNFLLLVVVAFLSIHIMSGRHSRAKVFLVSSIVFFIMMLLTAFCVLIYWEYRS